MIALLEISVNTVKDPKMNHTNVYKCLNVKFLNCKIEKSSNQLCGIAKSVQTLQATVNSEFSKCMNIIKKLQSQINALEQQVKSKNSSSSSSYPFGNTPSFGSTTPSFGTATPSNSNYGSSLNMDSAINAILNEPASVSIANSGLSSSIHNSSYNLGQSNDFYRGLI